MPEHRASGIEASGYRTSENLTPAYRTRGWTPGTGHRKTERQHTGHLDGHQDRGTLVIGIKTLERQTSERWSSESERRNTEHRDIKHRNTGIGRTEALRCRTPGSPA